MAAAFTSARGPEIEGASAGLKKRIAFFHVTLINPGFPMTKFGNAVTRKICHLTF